MSEVSKSKIPGGPWKKVTDLTSTERILVRRGKPHSPFNPTEEPYKNNLPRNAIYQGRKRRVLGQHSKDRFVLDGENGEKAIAHRSNVTFVKNAFGVEDPRVGKPS